MVDGWTGRWYPEEDYSKYPEEKLCDCDRLCIAIRAAGYTPRTSMENLVNMVMAHFDDSEHYGEYDPETGCGGYGDSFTIEGCLQYIEDSGGWKEFDYVP
jgi:hypothetical protein